MDDLTGEELRILVIAYWSFNGVCPAGNGDVSRLTGRELVSPYGLGGCFMLPRGLEVLSRKYKGKVPPVGKMGV